MTTPAFDTEEANNLLIELGRQIVTDVRYANDLWDSLSLVFRLDDGLSMFGYTYTDDGKWQAGVPKNSDVLYTARNLQTATTKPGEQPWKSCLIQIKRPDLTLHIDFEYNDEDRWKIIPGDHVRCIEAIRPS